MLNVKNWFNVDNLWYQKRIILWPLLPFAWIYTLLVRLRQRGYQKGWLQSAVFGVPVLVVGNITVGGTGKTPLVIYIVELLKQQGWRPGVISSGYKGKTKVPLAVHPQSDPTLVGDEALVLAKYLNCPLMVGKNRLLALQMLLKENRVNVIIADDGLQHYTMRRTVEIAVIDGERRFGNGYCLPVGPLREPIERLKQVDMIVTNSTRKKTAIEPKEYLMTYMPQPLYNISQPEHHQIIEAWRGKQVHAVAGIGNPKRFFQLLQDFGLQVISHAYPDHYVFSKNDIYFADDLPVIMTEKDAVKCITFVDNRHWALPIKAALEPTFNVNLINLLQKVA